MAQVLSDYRYSLEMFRNDEAGEHLGTASIQPDFQPVAEWARWQTLRRGSSADLNLDAGEVKVEPCWNKTAGNPHVEAIRVTVNGSSRKFEIPLGYFEGLARRASSELVKQGTLQKGELFQYRVCAYRSPQSAESIESSPGVQFTVEPVAETLKVPPGKLDRWLVDSEPTGSTVEEDLSVFVPQNVLDEAQELSQVAGARETGGILIGRLHWDEDRDDLFLAITAQIPVQHAEQELTRLTFTPDTWAAVDAAIALRNEGEMYVGWWHSHPAGEWCSACPPEVQAKCKAAGKVSGDFFSTHDVALHRAVFPRAYNVALLISGNSCEADSVVWSMFGWRYGMVAAREFYVLAGTDLPQARV